jgi:uncharacterized protein YcbK (DUF882 family)
MLRLIAFGCTLLSLVLVSALVAADVSSATTQTQQLSDKTPVKAAVHPKPEAIIVPSLPEKELRLYDIHSQKSIEVVFWKDGAYVPEALEKLNHFLKDRRNGRVTKMDPELFMLLHRIHDTLDASGPIHIISAYRSRESNEAMRAAGRGVAKKSQHVEGKAIDIRIPGIPTKVVRDTALKMGVGGVGYCAKSDFVHVDTGRPRFW